MNGNKAKHSFHFVQATIPEPVIISIFTPTRRSSPLYWFNMKKRGSVDFETISRNKVIGPEY